MATARSKSTRTNWRSGTTLSREFEEKQPHIASYEDAVATEYAALQKSRNQYDSMLAHMESRLSGPERTAEQWGSTSSRRRDRLLERVGRSSAPPGKQARHRVRNVERIANEQAAEQRKQVEEYVAIERTKLLEALPDWKDEAEAIQGASMLPRHTRRRSASPMPKSRPAYDHRMVLLLDKARRYDALVEKKSAARKTGRGCPQMAEPGARTRAFRCRWRVRDRLAATRKLEKNGGKITDTVARGLPAVREIESNVRPQRHRPDLQLHHDPRRPRRRGLQDFPDRNSGHVGDRP